jgi:hypothetical protein
MSLERFDVFFMVEPVHSLLILNAVPVPEGQLMIRTGRKEGIISRVGTPPDLFDDVVSKLTLKEGRDLELSDEI